MVIIMMMMMTMMTMTHHASCAVACEILIYQPGIHPRSPAVEAQIPNQWTAREFLIRIFRLLKCLFLDFISDLLNWKLWGKCQEICIVNKSTKRWYDKLISEAPSQNVKRIFTNDYVSWALIAKIHKHLHTLRHTHKL